MVFLRISPATDTKFLVELVQRRLYTEIVLDKVICEHSELECQIGIFLRVTENLSTDENI